MTHAPTPEQAPDEPDDYEQRARERIERDVAIADEREDDDRSEQQ